MNDLSHDRPNWHGLSQATVVDRLDVVPETGLSGEAARQRLFEYGNNEIRKRTRTPGLRLVLDQFKDFMILVLIAAALIAGVIGDVFDTVVILVIVLLNAVVGATQQYRSERAIAALRSMTARQARVLRDARIHVVPETELVPGDIMLFEAGNVIPADARLLQSSGVSVLEAVLTGESQPVEKHTEPIEGDEVALGDRSNMVFMGTQVARGHGTAVVVATAMLTELGRIAALLDEQYTQKTPLQARLAQLGRHLGLAVLFICAIVLVAGVVRGEDLMLMLLTSVSLAVAAIPEGLPAVVIVSLALGARAMSRQHALVRRLPAVEALGSVTTICADKTGTLTENRMHLESVHANDLSCQRLPAPRNDETLWTRVGRAFALNNDATISAAKDMLGDPTEVALLQAASAPGYDKQQLERAHPRIAEIAFDADRKCMTTVHDDGDSTLVITKGAPETVLPLCTRMRTATGCAPAAVDDLLSQAQHLSAQGFRVLAFAERHLSAPPEIVHPDEVERELTFLALAALIDPPREEVPRAVQECLAAGITPVMITGDHPSTAKAIAVRIGIAEADEVVLSGPELASISGHELRERIRNTRVYARVNPEQKIAIVEALQEQGQYVAMTGDGVNDAPALKRAVIGVAMGRGGTDVAREASDMVLLDDNFATIVAAVRQGRRIFDNIRKFVRYTLTSNTGEIWTLFLAPFLGLPIPLLPIHILWINLVTDGLPGLALSVEREEKDIMTRRPRPPEESIFARGMWQQVIWIGVLIGGLSILAQAWAIDRGSAAWQTVVFTVLTFSQLANALAIRSERQSLLTIGLFSNRPLLAAVLLTVLLQVAIIYVPVLNVLFNTQPLTVDELLVCFGLALVVLLAVEVEKFLVRRGRIYTA